MKIREGIIAYYELEETSGDVVDSIGDNDGTNHGATRGVTGKIGNAFDFDGSNDYIDCPQYWDSSYTGLTWSLWFKNDYTGSDDKELISYSNDGIGMYLKIDSGNNLLFEGLFSNGDKTTEMTYSQDNEWHHVVGTVEEDGNMKLYFDGVLQDTEAVGNFAEQFDKGQKIASKRNGGDYFDGTIDEVVIWNRAITKTEVEYLYNNGDGRGLPFYNTESSTGILKLGKDLGFNKKVSNLFGKRPTGNEIRTSDGNVKQIVPNIYQSIALGSESDIDIFTAKTEIERLRIEEKGTYLILAGIKANIFNEDGGWSGIEIWLEKNNTEIDGTKRATNFNLGATGDIDKSFQTTAICELEDGDGIALIAKVTETADAGFGKDHNLLIIKLSDENEQ